MSLRILEAGKQDPSDIIDRAGLMRLVDDDVPLLREIIALFLEEYPGGLENIKQALASGDARKLRLAAHTLKGTAGNFQAQAAHAAAHALEEMGRAADFTGAGAALDHLENNLHQLEQALRTFTDELPT